MGQVIPRGSLAYTVWEKWNGGQLRNTSLYQDFKIWSIQNVFFFPLSLCLWLCFKVPRVPVHTLAMVVPPQEPDRTPPENSPPLLGVVKG